MSNLNDQKVTEIYLKSQENKYRYALGTIGERTLYCFGINPSTATDVEDDQTVRRVKKFAQKSGYDSVVMLNVYPQRATNPDNLDKGVNLIEHQRNLKNIISVIKEGSVVWAAWGNLIGKRPYLKECLVEIQSKLKPRNIHWVKIGDLTKEGNPRHPLYLRFQAFTEYVVE